MKTESTRLWLACALWLGLTVSARADDAQAPLNLAEAARMALASLPELAALEQRVDAAEERVASARGRYAPVVSLRGGLSKSTDTVLVGRRADGELVTRQPSVLSLQTAANARLDLYDFGARRHALRSQRALVELSRADLSSAQLSAVLNVVELYLTVLRDERRVKDAELSVSIQERQVTAISRLVERRARPEVDLQRAEVQLQAARDNVEILAAETRRDRVQLALVLGVRSVEGVALEPVADAALHFDPRAEEAARVALAQRPEARAARANTLARTESARAAGAALAPRLSVEASASYTKTLDASRPIEPFDRSQASAGLFLTWDGLDPSAWAERRAQRADAAAAELDAKAVDRELRASALFALEEQSRASAFATRAQHLREGTQAALDAQQKRYELGAASLLELLDAQSLEQQARAQLIDAELAQELAMARVLFACGVLADRALAP